MAAEPFMRACRDASTSQVMSLLWLSTRLHEILLTLPRQFATAESITTETAIQIAKEIDFVKQEELFNKFFYETNS